MEEGIPLQAYLHEAPMQSEAPPEMKQAYMEWGILLQTYTGVLYVTGI